jgi:hypothetical protein
VYREDVFEPIELVLSIGGKLGKAMYRLEAAQLSLETVGKPESRATFALTDIVQVRLSAFGGTTTCEMHHKDGTKFALSSGLLDADKKDPAHERAYGEILRALHERILINSPDAKFITGTWASAIALVVIAALCGGILYWLGTDPVQRAMLRFTIMEGMVALLVLVALPMAILRGRPKPYDPRKIPRAYDAAPR